MADVDINPLLEQLTHLKEIEGEYRITLPVLAIVVERLLDETGAEAVVINGAALQDSPDLVAKRDGDSIVIKVER